MCVCVCGEVDGEVLAGGGGWGGVPGVGVGSYITRCVGEGLRHTHTHTQSSGNVRVNRGPGNNEEKSD